MYDVIPGADSLLVNIQRLINLNVAFGDVIVTSLSRPSAPHSLSMSGKKEKLSSSGKVLPYRHVTYKTLNIKNLRGKKMRGRKRDFEINLTCATDTSD